jgi:hypothetical protein
VASPASGERGPYVPAELVVVSCPHPREKVVEEVHRFSFPSSWQPVGCGGGQNEDESEAEEHDLHLLSWVVLDSVGRFAVDAVPLTANEKNKRHAPSANLTLWVMAFGVNVSSRSFPSG